MRDEVSVTREVPVLRGPAGYNGRLLTVDLNTGSTEVETPGEDEWRRYVGGGLMAVRRLLTHTSPKLDPFDPAALLMFLSSAVAGHQAVGLTKFTVIAKSPLTGGVGEARVTGPFGVGLKASGYDGVVIQGRCDRPSYLLLEDGEARVVPAPELWGTDVAETTDRLKVRHGQGALVAAIGPSGEQLVRFASIVVERTHSAARMGLGSVMGAKNLKAVVIGSGSTPEPWDSGELAAITADYAAGMRTNPLTAEQYEEPGFGAWLLQGDVTGRAGVGNFTTSVLPDLSDMTAVSLSGGLLHGSGGCPGCPNDCIKIFANSVDERAGALDEEVLAAFALGLGITDLPTVLDLNARCHQWGIDPVSLVFTLSMLCEATALGFVPAGLLAALPGGKDTFGDREHLMRLIEGVALRRPGLEWLGEGSRRAAERIGPQAASCALHVKGLEMVSFDPRTSAGQALAYAVSPLGPRYDIVEHDIDFDPDEGYPHGLEQMRTLGTMSWEPMANLDATRVARTSILLELWSGLDALGICLFAGPPLRELSLPTVARLVSAVTGWTTSDQEILVWGRRRWQLMRVYNLREGLTADDDRLPDRFFRRPVDAGRHAGAVLDEDGFASALDDYYELAGWDRDGRPRRSTLTSLGLDWAVIDDARQPAAGGPTERICI